MQMIPLFTSAVIILLFKDTIQDALSEVSDWLGKNRLVVNTLISLR